MDVHLFGAVSSPSIANLALKTAGKTATSVVAETIERNFYVDDIFHTVFTLIHTFSHCFKHVVILTAFLQMKCVIELGFENIG